MNARGLLLEHNELVDDLQGKKNELKGRIDDTTEVSINGPVQADTAQLLSRASLGDRAAADRLLPLVYDELRRLAAVYLKRGDGGAAMTLRPTDMVHEAFLRLVNRPAEDFEGRSHFFAVAATAMRRVLIDHLRGQRRAKRGGNWKRVTLTGIPGVSGDKEIELLALDEALTRFAELDKRASQVVELRFFGRLSTRQIAEELGVSERTIRNDWSVARAWLRSEMGVDAEEDVP